MSAFGHVIGGLIFEMGNVGTLEQAVAGRWSARRSNGPSGTGGSAADHRLTATCAA